MGAVNIALFRVFDEGSLKHIQAGRAAAKIKYKFIKKIQAA